MSEKDIILAAIEKGGKVAGDEARRQLGMPPVSAAAPQEAAGSPAPAKPSGASVETPGLEQESFAGRRRGKKKNGTPQPRTDSVKPPAAVVAPVADAVQAATPGNKDADDSHTANPFAPRKRGGKDGDAVKKAQEAMDRAVAEAAAVSVPDVVPAIVSQYTEIDERRPQNLFRPQRKDRKVPQAAQPAPAVESPEIPVLTDAAALAETAEGETPDQAVARLKNEVDELRAGYVQADYDETNAWARVRKFFGKTLSGSDEREWQEKQYNKKGNYSDGVYWQAQYQNKLVDLKNAELASVRQRALDGVGWKKEMADMIRYFDLDEPVNLIEARTEHRARQQNWPTKVFDSFGAVGRSYNKLSMKEKLAITAVCAGGALALTLSGGTAAGALAGLLVVARRALGIVGMSVGTEALLDSSRKTYQTEETEKEIERLFGETPEKGFDFLEAEMQKKVFAMDDELQKAKLTKLLHKTGALSVGAFVGSGWLTEIAMNQWGGNEAADWVKERFNSIVSGADGTVAPAKAVTPDVPQAAAEAKAVLIAGFADQDIVVGKGDSVWKISGKLADQLGLAGSQKTHFVDALKDQYGDVLLKEGETINFATRGIDQDFVEKALQDAHTLTPAESIAIETNDARIGAYAQANPGITLTNEAVNNILEVGESDFAATTPDAVSAGGAFGQETIAARGVPPEMTALYDTRADDWYAQIFRVEDASFGQDWLIDKEAIGRVRLLDILADARLFQQGAASGYATGLDQQQITNFAKFFQGVSENGLGFDRAAFFRENPNATVMDYLNKVAPLVHPGQRIGLYTTTK